MTLLTMSFSLTHNILTPTLIALWMMNKDEGDEKIINQMLKQVRTMPTKNERTHLLYAIHLVLFLFKIIELYIVE